MVLAALGQRECDDGGYERLATDERAPVRRQAAWVILGSALIGIVLTALAWLV